MLVCRDIEKKHVVESCTVYRVPGPARHPIEVPSKLSPLLPLAVFSVPIRTTYDTTLKKPRGTATSQSLVKRAKRLKNVSTGNPNNILARQPHQSNKRGLARVSEAPSLHLSLSLPLSLSTPWPYHSANKPTAHAVTHTHTKPRRRAKQERARQATTTLGQDSAQPSQSVSPVILSCATTNRGSVGIAARPS